MLWQRNTKKNNLFPALIFDVHLFIIILKNTNKTLFLSCWHSLVVIKWSLPFVSHIHLSQTRTNEYWAFTCPIAHWVGFSVIHTKNTFLFKQMYPNLKGEPVINKMWFTQRIFIFCIWLRSGLKLQKMWHSFDIIQNIKLTLTKISNEKNKRKKKKTKKKPYTTIRNDEQKIYFMLNVMRIKNIRRNENNVINKMRPRLSFMVEQILDFKRNRFSVCNHYKLFFYTEICFCFYIIKCCFCTNVWQRIHYIQ